MEERLYFPFMWAPSHGSIQISFLYSLKNHGGAALSQSLFQEVAKPASPKSFPAQPAPQVFQHLKSHPSVHGHRRIPFYFPVKTSDGMYKGALEQLQEGGGRAAVWGSTAAGSPQHRTRARDSPGPRERTPPLRSGVLRLLSPPATTRSVVGKYQRRRRQRASLAHPICHLPVTACTASKVLI